MKIDLDGPTAWGYFVNWVTQAVELWNNQVVTAIDERSWRVAFQGWRECTVRAVESLNELHSEPSIEQWNLISQFYRLIFDMPNTCMAMGHVFELNDRLLEAEGKDLRYRWFRMSETNIGEYHILDLLCKRKLMGWTDLEEVLVFVNHDKIVNVPYLNMWADVLPDFLKIIPYRAEEDVPPEIVPATHCALTEKYLLPLPQRAGPQDPIPPGSLIHPALRTTSGGGSNWDGTAVWKERYYQVLNEYWARAPLLELDDAPDEWGKWVCLHVREGSWKHESNYDRHACRNADIDDYKAAIEQITGHGLKVVRLGHPGMKPLKMAGVVDLAHVEHDPKLDIAAVANAELFMGPDSGPSSMAPAFGTASLITDLYPVTRRPPLAGDVYVPRLIKARWAYPGRNGWTDGDRILTVEEMFRPPWYDMPVSEPFKGFRCDWVPNTPEELADAVEDIFTTNYRARAEKMLQKYDSCDKFDDFGFQSTCAPSFLKKHKKDLGL